MSDDRTGARLRAQSGNYATDENLRLRQALFDYVVPPKQNQPKLQKLFKWRPDATVLDIGCGNGLFAQTASTLTPQGMVIGLDNSPGMLAALRSRTLEVTPVLGDGHRLPIRSNSLDAVLALWVLYHLRDKGPVFDEVKRTLRAGGLFIAATNSSEPIRGVDDLITQALESVMGRRVDRWIEPLDFTVENGKELLASHFPDVDLIVSETAFEVPVAQPLLDSVRSVKGPIQAAVGPGLQFDSFLETLRSLLEQQLAAGPIRFKRKSGFFVALSP